jgi:class 3 adenylate cyclase/pimeloyl-ACP methyl ester carboxylesterase
MSWGSGEVAYARKADGTAIAYRVLGDGPVDLVFGAGLACHLDLLRGDPHCTSFFGRLARLGRVVVFDKPGTGLSDPLTAPPSIGDRADDHLAVMDAAGVRRAVLVRFSEAGGPAAVLAASYPERVEGLVLLSAAIRFTCDAEYLPELHDHLENHIWRALWHSYDHWGDGSLLLAISPWVRESLVYRRLAPSFERACASPAMLRTILTGLRTYDARAALAALRVPTLVVCRRDEWVPAGVAVDTAERVEGARLALLPGDEHLCYFGGDDIADQIERFVDGGPVGGPSARPRRRDDRALVTLLFTDIVGSTTEAAAMGDARWRAVLAHHDAVLADTVDRLGGRVVKNLGDGALAAFDRPAVALRAAAALHEATADLGLQLRAGLHTGECELVGEDVVGLAVHLAARVAALAGPSETLATSTVRDLVLGSGTCWADRGSHVLKGVPGTWHVLAVGTAPEPAPVPVDEPPRAGGRAVLLAAGRAPAATRLAMRVLGRARSPRPAATSGG